MGSKSRLVAKLTTSMLGGAAVLLGASSAQAQTSSCWFGTPFGDLQQCTNETSLTVGDKTISNITLGSQITDPPIPFTGSGTANWQLIGDGGPDWSDDEFAFSLNFSPILSSPPIDAGVAFAYGYTVQINDPAWFFDSVVLESDSANSRGAETAVLKLGSNVGFTETFVLQNTNGSQVGPRSYTFANDFTQLAIVDAFTLNPKTTPPRESAKLTSITNTFTQRPGGISKVPGPLPLLGAGVAFGFSRRLRKRIKLYA